MTRTYHHVVGTTQYEGTCKMHLFPDCHQLQKRRIAHMAWGDRDSTGVTASVSIENLKEWRICRICAKREKLNPGPTETTSGTRAVSQREDSRRV
jgi:hypothetical protein